jgi:hypothetical protein
MPIGALFVRLQGTVSVICSPNMDGKQGGDPTKLADALVKLVALKEPPTRFAAGADAVQTFETKANTLLAQGQANRELSSSLAY